jgi:hypothetical protein
MGEISEDPSLQKPSTFWQALENSVGRDVFVFEWKRELSQDFLLIRDLFLRKATRNKARPLGMVTTPSVLRRIRDFNELKMMDKTGKGFIPDWYYTKSTDDYEILLEWNWENLCRLFARAFGLHPKYAEVNDPFTRQIGEVSDLPVLLTIQSDENAFHLVAANLVASLNQPFILLAPTRRFFNIKISKLLSRRNAAFFDLASQIDSLSNGSLQAHKSGGELFSPFLPEHREALSENDASRLFVLFQKLKLETAYRKASLCDVFTLLVLDKMSQADAAKKLRCSEGTISARVKVIEDKMQNKIEILRNSASEIRNMDIEKDPRARKLFRKGLTDDTKSDDDD